MSDDDFFPFVETLILHIFQKSMKYPIKCFNFYCSPFYMEYDKKKKHSF